MDDQLRPMRVGQIITIGPLVIVRHTRRSFCARDTRSGRGRWGTRLQILEDLAHFDLTGQLPREKHNYY